MGVLAEGRAGRIGRMAAEVAIPGQLCMAHAYLED